VREPGSALALVGALSPVIAVAAVAVAGWLIYPPPFILRSEIDLETLHDVFERAYWYYVAKRFKENGVLLRVVDLRDLLPIINEELKKRGYTRELTLRELFDALKLLEQRQFEEGWIWFMIGWRLFPGEDQPIPVEIFEPRRLTVKELKELGIPVESEQAKMLWKL
jgi:hypothetical protein